MTNPENSRAEPGVKTTRERYLAVLQEASQIIATAEGTTEEILLAVLQRLMAELEYCAVQVYRLSSSGSDLWLYLEQGSGNKPVTQNVDIFSVDEQSPGQNQRHQTHATKHDQAHAGRTRHAFGDRTGAP